MNGLILHIMNINFFKNSIVVHLQKQDPIILLICTGYLDWNAAWGSNAITCAGVCHLENRLGQ